MSAEQSRRLSGQQELEADQRTELLIFWKGLLAVVVIALIVVVRSWWWV